tara:strand:- start:5 stop:649 length:645 start_codon:yes stop_codon:yes gene_type:complete
MSDPRIYHRVGPNAPEGRQIYDDIRRRDLGLSSSFNSQLSTVNSTLTGEITTLEGQVNALAVTPVQVGTGTGYTRMSMATITTATVSSVTVTPVVATPFMLEIRGGLTLFSGLNTRTFKANIYEGITWIQNLYQPAEAGLVPVDTVDFRGKDSGTAIAGGRGGIPIGLGATILIPNTGTSSRTFEFKVNRNGGTSSGSSAQHAGTFNAFQWTVA